ncbi:MAG: hypothetical protein U0X20_32820 [Caldilineaceae bacterium]
MNVGANLNEQCAAIVQHLPPIKVEAVPSTVFLRALTELNLPTTENLPELLWHHGVAYVSSVVYSNESYQPSPDCQWSFHPLPRFFGNNSSYGTYQITPAAAGSRSLRLLATLRLPYAAYSMVHDAKNNRLVIGDQVGGIHVFDAATLQYVLSIDTKLGRTWSMTCIERSGTIVSGHQSGYIALWDLDGHCQGHMDSGSWIRAVAMAPDGATCLTAHSAGTSTIRRWSISPLKVIDEYSAYKTAVWSVDYFPDGTGFVSGGKDAMFSAHWFAALGTPAYANKKHKGGISSVVMHPSGKYAATGSWTGTIKLWNVTSGEVINSLEAHAERITGLRFSDDGLLLVSVDKDGEIALWQVPQGEPLLHYDGHNGWIRSVCFLNETQIATAGSDGMCKIWLLTSGLPISDLAEIRVAKGGGDELGLAGSTDDE